MAHGVPCATMDLMIIAMLYKWLVDSWDTTLAIYLLINSKMYMRSSVILIIAKIFNVICSDIAICYGVMKIEWCLKVHILEWVLLEIICWIVLYQIKYM